MKFSIKDFLSKFAQIRSFLRIWSQLLKKSLRGKTSFFAQWDIWNRDLLQLRFSIGFGRVSILYLNLETRSCSQRLPQES